jgi:hypothetical protein
MPSSREWRHGYAEHSDKETAKLDGSPEQVPLDGWERLCNNQLAECRCFGGDKDLAGQALLPHQSRVFYWTGASLRLLHTALSHLVICS